VALGTNVGYWQFRFMDIFITMPFQATGQDGHCGRAVGDFQLDWHGSTVASGESLFSGTAMLQLDAGAREEPTPATENGTCVEGEALEDNRVPCETALAASEFGMLFVNACVSDVCAGGQGIIEHYEAFAMRVFNEYAAEAQAKQKCDFPYEPQDVGYFWDPMCQMGESLGCGADGAHAECRLCGGTGPYASISCPGEQEP